MSLARPDGAAVAQWRSDIQCAYGAVSQQHRGRWDRAIAEGDLDVAWGLWSKWYEQALVQAAEKHGMTGLHRAKGHGQVTIV
eukprot:4701145-Alexandrium_andersonii.AAC.1